MKEGQLIFEKACSHHQRGELELAEKLYREAIELDDKLVDCWRNLGAMLRQRGRPEEGLICQQKALELSPDDPGIMGNLGNVLRDLDRLDESVDMFERALVKSPKSIGAYLGLAISLNKNKKHKLVIQQVTQFAEGSDKDGQDSDLSQLLLELGNAHHHLKNNEEAIKYWKLAEKKTDPINKISMVLNSAQVLCEQQKFHEAEELLLPYLDQNEKQANILYAMGVVTRGQSKWEEACEWFEKALDAEPNYPICLNTYGLLMREIGQIHKARSLFEKAIQIDKEFGAAMNNLGSVLKDVARYDEALKWLRKGAKQLGENAAAHSNVLFTLFGYELEDPERRYLEAKNYGRIYSKAPYERWKDRLLWPSTERKLKVGFISPDFCRHAVSYFIEPLLEQWRKMEIITVLYAAGKVRDDYSIRLKGKANYWREIEGETDEKIVDQIIQDEVDILVDLAGHTAGNKLTVFTHKAAPIQATYLGYYGTTGLDKVDYWITDRKLHPKNNEDDDFCCEAKWRLNRAYVSYRPINESPKVAELPMIERKVPMVGSFNQSRKITSKTAENWMAVLEAVPNAHLYIKSKNLGEETESKRIRQLFKSLGLDDSRLHLEGHSVNVATHLDRYRNLDIALDTFPYTGCTTTADALWMGVPVLTVEGTTMVSRQASAVLEGAGHKEWICKDKDELASKAKAILGDTKKLKDIRKNLRQQLIDSDLMDHYGLAKELERTFYLWWKKHLLETDLTPKNDTKNKCWPKYQGREALAKYSPIPS